MKPAVIAISSHVARGSVGNRAAVFVLETMGFPVWSVPTIILPWHPGHGQSTKIVPDAKLFDEFIANLAHSPWLGEVGAVLTGYLGDPSQALAIAELIKAVKRQNPHATYICDPVIGDNGGLYVPSETASAIRDVLLPMADMATPNRFELEWLSGDTRQPLADLAQRLGPHAVLVTSAGSGKNSGNLLVTGDHELIAAHKAIARPPNGLGDLTAALFLAHRLGGHGDEVALARTTSSVLELLSRSMKNGADELALEANSDCLLNPSLNIPIECINIGDFAG